MKIAIVGSGVSGIAAAKTLGRLSHDVTLFERTGRVGGVWAEAYPGVHLQIMSELYCYPDFPWPFEHDPYPSAEEVLRYIHAAMEHFGITAQLNSDVRKLTPDGDGWLVEVATPEGIKTSAFGAVVVATGNYTGEKAELDVEGREAFKGEVLTQHDIADFAALDGKRVAVVGFGKSAIDMLAFSRVMRGSCTMCSAKRAGCCPRRSWACPRHACRRNASRPPTAPPGSIRTRD